MEEYVLLQKDNMGAYAHMIPAWLFMKPGEEKEVQFWGMSDFKTPCGVAVLSREEEVITLQYLYVEKAHRGQGK